MERGVIVVGAGHAAGEFVIRLRQSGYAGPVTMVGAERHLPYQRPPLSKAFLSGEIAEDALLLRPPAFFEQHAIGFLGGLKVERIDRGRHAIMLADGSELHYDKLVLATGGRARRLACPGKDLAGIYYLRTIDDVAGIREHFLPGARLVIIGGGYIGLEVAAVAAKRGLHVTVLEAAARVLARVARRRTLDLLYQSAYRCWCHDLCRRDGGGDFIRAK